MGLTGLIVKSSIRINGIQRLWLTVKTRFWHFMDRIAKAHRDTPACRG